MTPQPNARTMAPSNLRQRSRAKKAGLGLAILVATLASTAVASAGDLPSTADATAASHERDMAEARKQFQAGVNLLDDPDGAKYEEAYSAFRKAYELSQSPKVLGNVGFCAMHLERDGEAIDAYTKYLSETLDVSERERAQIQKDLATLTSTVARVRVIVKRPGARYVLIDTRVQTRGPSVENSYSFDGNETTIRIRPGRHTIKVRADGEESLPVEAALEPAAQVSHEIRFAPPKTAEPGPILVRQSPSVAGPVLLGVTGLLAIGAGTVTGLLARSKTNDIQARCPNDVCPPEYNLEAARGSAKTLGTIADTTLIGGGALVGGALLWYILLPSAKRSTTAATANAMCTRDGCSVQLQRGF